VLLLAIGGAGWWAYQTYPEQVKTLFGWSNDYTGAGTGSVQVQIRPGAIGSDIAATLTADRVTKTESAFYDLLVKTQPEPSLLPGTYRLKQHMSAKAALAALQDPKNRVESIVTIPEGSTAKQILSITSEATGKDLAELKKLAKDWPALGVPKTAPNIEGWLFPATYTFQPGVTSKQMLQQMVDRTKKALDDAGVPASRREKVLTLAGLVQKEGNGKDDAKVARVFLNRVAQSATARAARRWCPRRRRRPRRTATTPTSATGCRSARSPARATSPSGPRCRPRRASGCTSSP
jgi:UPF0755 protein